MRRFVSSAVALGFVAAAALVAPAAYAQKTTDPSTSSRSSEGQTGEQGGATAAPKSTGNMGGYSYGDGRSAARASSGAPKARVVHRHGGPVVNLPGFEPLPDGGSRLFVQLTQTVPVDEKKAQGSITYVLKGASARVHNNTNALVTVHFNTPVSRARLVPRGSDLLFVVELRAAATPTWKIVEGPEKTSVLQIDFPKGNYARADSGEVPVGGSGAGEGDEGASEQSDAAGETPGTAPAPRARGKKKKNTPAAPAGPAKAGATGPTP